MMWQDARTAAAMAKAGRDFEAQLMWGKSPMVGFDPIGKKKTRRKMKAKSKCVVWNGKGVWEQLGEPQIQPPLKEFTLDLLTNTIKDCFYGKPEPKKQPTIDLWNMKQKIDMPLLKLSELKSPSNTRRKQSVKKQKIIMLDDSDKYTWTLPVPTNFPVIVTNTTMMP